MCSNLDCVFLLKEKYTMSYFHYSVNKNFHPGYSSLKSHSSLSFSTLSLVHIFICTISGICSLPCNHSSSSSIHTLVQASGKFPQLRNFKNLLKGLSSRLFTFIHFPYDSVIIFSRKSYKNLTWKRNE